MRRIAGHNRREEENPRGAVSKDQKFEHALTCMLDDDEALNQINRKQAKRLKARKKNPGSRNGNDSTKPLGRMPSGLWAPSREQPRRPVAARSFSEQKQHGSSLSPLYAVMRDGNKMQTLRGTNFAKKKRSLFEVEGGGVGNTMSL